MSHTPGQWIANAGHDNYLKETFVDDPIPAFHVSESSEVGYTVAIVLGDVPELDCEANARLIAAAPELLEALKLCYDHCLLYHPEIEYNNVGETVRAAIAKAEGKS